MRFPPSLRNVEDLLDERGIEVSHETIRFWRNRFGLIFHSCRSGDENTRCSVSGKCEASRNSPPSILPSTIISTCDDPSAHGTLSSSSAPLHSPSGALVHESELARNEPDSQVHHLPRAYDDGLPSSAIRLRM